MFAKVQYFDLLPFVKQYYNREWKFIKKEGETLNLDRYVSHIKKSAQLKSMECAQVGAIEGVSKCSQAILVLNLGLCWQVKCS